MEKIVFFGTPAFVLPVLETLKKLPYELVAVVTAPDKPIGRKQVVTLSPAKEWALAHNIGVLQPEKLDEQFLEELQRSMPTLGIIAAYGKIIPQKVLAVFEHGVINVHPSLLPRWRGAAPVQATIAAADQKTGITLMLTDQKMDHGPIIAQESSVLLGNETGKELTRQLFLKGANLLEKILPKWLAGEIQPTPQEHLQATYAKVLKRDDGRLDFSKPADELSRLIRAYTPWPGTFFEKNDVGRMKILSAHALKEKAGAAPSEFVPLGNTNIGIACGEGILMLDSVQKEGRKPISGQDLRKGLQLWHQQSVSGNLTPTKKNQGND